MDIWHGYFAAELLNITNGQKTALIAAFQGLRGVDPEGPQHITHWRVRSDKNAAIFEARFNADNLTVANVIQFLANAVGVDPGIISTSTTQTARGPLVTFTAGGTDRLRMIAFAGIHSTWLESRAQCAAYIAANQAEWNAQ